MSRIAVVAANVVCGLGANLDATWDGLLQGRSAIAPLARFDCNGYLTDLASCVDGLSRQSGCSRLEPLLAQLLDGLPGVPVDSRLLTATTKGAIDLLEDQVRGADRNVAPLLLENFPREIAGRLGLAERGMNVNAACASSTIALARGGALIAAGRAEAVLVVCADLVSEFVFSGFSALQGLATTPCRPFDSERSGLSLGEGAAALLLMSEDRARRDGREVLAWLLGWGVANDANHITAPARDGCGLLEAIHAALGRAGLSAGAVAAISAHGTGTLYNDAMEMTAFGQLFGTRRLPVNSIKGAIGHTLGAAGGIEAAIACRCLTMKQLPPTVGCLRPDAAAAGRILGSTQTFDGEVLLSTNSGFGGINAALLLGVGGER